MAKKGIYITTNRPLMGYNKNEEKIFNYLLKCTDSATQTQIAQKLDMSRSTVIRTLGLMKGKEFRSKGSSYTIICENKKYSMLRNEKTTKGLKDSATYEQKKEFSDKFDTASEKLSTLNVLLSTTSENISDNTVRYHIDIKYAPDVASIIKRLYNDDIYDIATGDNGIYIVLKDNKMDEEIIKSLQSLYIDAVEGIKYLYPEEK